ncbi:UdgX family uracil-DNA binding protein [Marivita hallyeonensis]|uniref:Type-4 uracil-DNA glycosylase n=1 Tax=Marivita hallyeonensis TaxID=996342 RepID=A0A1M5VUW9_9RHOB|nr:UdgX family uracil-DNA binding protein [Marivita hallyeonensis]SHH78980.1 DNA polymerase [Marivita hallyeonensis]
MFRITLPEIGTFDAWRDAARRALAASIPPETVIWQRGAGEVDLFGTESAALPDVAAQAGFTVPKTYLSTVKLALWHRDPERFSRAYAVLWDLQSTPRLFEDCGDPRVAKLNALAKEVGRDKHKMTAFVRFRDIGDRTAPRRRFAAWFEPSHHIVEPTAPFFAKRFGDMDWTIFTPDLTAVFEGGKVRFEPGVEKPPLPEDATEELWGTYFRNIFNPARVKLKAMQAEMPKKYWKNMPETAHLPEMIAGARARAAEMQAAAPTLPPLRAEKVTARVSDMLGAARASGGEERMTDALASCRRCPLWQDATQAVPGEGPLDARLMFVGEQPGDREDLEGRPFVGPAGQLLDRALEATGIVRSEVYLTNAVKHFKFVPRGKRRLHQSPNRDEIDHCRWWLDLERERVRPALIVALGATALRGLTGNGDGLLKRRGKVEMSGGQPIFVTVHPSYLLRLRDAEQRQREERAFHADLKAAAEIAARMATQSATV